MALTQSLKGSTPMATSKFDQIIWIGWKNSFYLVKEGYGSLILQLPHPPSSKIWGKIWHMDGLPKINNFCWELVHGKILMMENLKSRKIQGPSRCVLC